MPVTKNWPIVWIESTFTSRARTEELLRPELDRSLLQSDFEKAAEFFPTRRWPEVCGITAVSVIACYGFLLRKPKWSMTRPTTWVALVGAAAAGAIFGDRNGFIRSLSNVKLGGPVAVDMEQEAIGSLEGGQSSTESTSMNAVIATRTDTSPPSRWDEIRAANARNAAQHSSWDALRQNHERNQVARTDDAYSSTENDRAQEQARFDAMLEAERRSSS